MRKLAFEFLLFSILVLLSGPVFSYVITANKTSISEGEEVTFTLSGDYVDFASLDLNINYSPSFEPVIEGTDLGFGFSLDALTKAGMAAGFTNRGDLTAYTLFDDPGVLGFQFVGGADESGSGDIAYFTFKAASGSAGTTGTIDLLGIADDLFGCDPIFGDSCYNFGEINETGIVATASVRITASNPQVPVPVPAMAYLMLAGFIAVYARKPRRCV